MTIVSVCKRLEGSCNCVVLKEENRLRVIVTETDSVPSR